MYQPQQRPEAQHLYKTDLDRHLFTPTPRRAIRQPPIRRTVADALRVWWHSGCSLWKSTVSYVNLFLS